MYICKYSNQYVLLWSNSDPKAVKMIYQANNVVDCNLLKNTDSSALKKDLNAIMVESDALATLSTIFKPATYETTFIIL